MQFCRAVVVCQAMSVHVSWRLADVAAVQVTDAGLAELLREMPDARDVSISTPGAGATVRIETCSAQVRFSLLSDDMRSE